MERVCFYVRSQLEGTEGGMDRYEEYRRMLMDKDLSYDKYNEILNEVTGENDMWPEETDMFWNDYNLEDMDMTQEPVTDDEDEELYYPTLPQACPAEEDMFMYTPRRREGQNDPGLEFVWRGLPNYEVPMADINVLMEMSPAITALFPLERRLQLNIDVQDKYAVEVLFRMLKSDLPSKSYWNKILYVMDNSDVVALYAFAIKYGLCAVRNIIIEYISRNDTGYLKKMLFYAEVHHSDDIGHADMFLSEVLKYQLYDSLVNMSYDEAERIWKKIEPVYDRSCTPMNELKKYVMSKHLLSKNLVPEKMETKLGEHTLMYVDEHTDRPDSELCIGKVFNGEAYVNIRLSRQIKNIRYQECRAPGKTYVAANGTVYWLSKCSNKIQLNTTHLIMSRNIASIVVYQGEEYLDLQKWTISPCEQTCKTSTDKDASEFIAVHTDLNSTSMALFSVVPVGENAMGFEKFVLKNQLIFNPAKYIK